MFRSIHCTVLAIVVGFLQLPAHAYPVATSPVDAVQQYNKFRQSGDSENAFKLLMGVQISAADLKNFNKVKEMPKGCKNKDKILAFIRFIADFDNSFGYHFNIIGLKPGNSHTVIIKATPPGKSPIEFEMVTTQDGNSFKLDFEGTAALLSPESLDRAREASCMSNMKMLSLGMLQYLQDNDDTYPKGTQWTDKIMPYVKDEKYFHCPSAPASMKWSYAFNNYLAAISDLKQHAPDTTVMFFESSTGNKNQADTGSSLCNPTRHPHGNAYAFCDGHVEILKTKPNGKYSWKP